ncbi:MAG TPA: proline racemase family protein [Candidatus Stackebrandtia excrementipullorum]|nr:proline racemase family protein [Candidatus Stackebrandtia excrementipullorum]
MLYIEVSGCLPICGHGSMGVATVMVETGMIEVHEPTTVVALGAPAGPVTAEVAVDDGTARSVTLRAAASHCESLDAVVDIPGLGPVDYDLAYGGIIGRRTRFGGEERDHRRRTCGHGRG